MFKNILSMTALAALVAPAFAAEWMTDFEAAKAKAAQENKAILVDFTGSDWCGYCIRLRKEVLDTPAFDEYAADKFVLMEVDLPRRKDLPPALFEQNNNLCKQYKIEGFPTLLVMTPEGKVMGGFGGYRPSVDAVKKPLDSALEVIKLYKEASAASGDEKARLLMKAYQAVSPDVRENTGLLQEVIAADTNKVTGAENELKEKEQWAEIQEAISQCPDDPHKVKAIIEKYLPIATSGNKQMLEQTLEAVDGAILMEEVDKTFHAEGPAGALAQVESKLEGASAQAKPRLLQAKFELQVLLSETAEDLEKAKATAAELRKLLPPDFQKQLDVMLVRAFSDTDKVLQDVKKQRDAIKKDQEVKKAKEAQETK